VVLKSAATWPHSPTSHVG